MQLLACCLDINNDPPPACFTAGLNHATGRSSSDWSVLYHAYMIASYLDILPPIQDEEGAT